jgi:hypothetical protein
MKKTKAKRKLGLFKETLKPLTLDKNRLQAVAGGVPPVRDSEDSCPTGDPWP